jgi:hypothetical protein
MYPAFWKDIPTMADSIDTRFLDKRVAPRYVRKGKLDEKEYERHLKALPDLEDQAVPVESEFEDTAED